jgi:hypothetical protein
MKSPTSTFFSIRAIGKNAPSTGPGEWQIFWDIVEKAIADLGPDKYEAVRITVEPLDDEAKKTTVTAERDYWRHVAAYLASCHAATANSVLDKKTGSKYVHQTAALKAEYPDTAVPYCPETTMRQQYEEEFKKDMGDVAKSIEALIQAAATLADKPSVNKADRKAFVDIAEGIRCRLANSIPFVQGQFNESLDRVLTEAKADLESFTDQLAHSLGSAALASQIKGAKADLQLPLGGGEDYTSAP